MARALIIGGTGPTGHFLTNGLLERGYDLAMLHTGRHELAENSDAIEHIHTDPFSQEALTTALADRSFDLVIATYGRLRSTAAVLENRTERFISVGGGPAYRGYMNAPAMSPQGMQTPTAEDALKVRSEAEDGKGYRVLRSEEVVFAHHPNATHFRYPYLYGPYQVVPREWCVVRRVLDKRPFIVVPDGGLSLNHFGYAGNVAHAVLLAVDQPAAAQGEVFNCGDITQLTLKQTVSVLCTALGASLDIIDMPNELAYPARPMLAQPWSDHRVFDLHKLRTRLGYTDLVDPVDALGQSARWLVEHPLIYGGGAERALQDPFDYAAEDALVAAWRKALASMPTIEYSQVPGCTASYSGPGGSVRKSDW